MPKPPSAMSRLKLPVGMPSMAARASPSSFITAPLPNCFSICWTARDRAESRAGSRGGGAAGMGLATPLFGIDFETGADDEADEDSFADDAEAESFFASALSADL